MRALRELFKIIIYILIAYLLLYFTLWGVVLYFLGFLIVWAENRKYDEIKISPLRVKFPLLTAILFLPILLVISFFNFFLFLKMKD